MKKCEDKRCRYNLNGECQFYGECIKPQEIKVSEMFACEMLEKLKPNDDIYIKATLLRRMNDYMLEHFDEIFEYSIQHDFPRNAEIYSAKLKYITSNNNGGKHNGD